MWNDKEDISQCDVCSKDSWSKWHLGVHVKTVHEGRFAHCDVCKKECWIMKDLRDHGGPAHEGWFEYWDVY